MIGLFAPTSAAASSLRRVLAVLLVAILLATVTALPAASAADNITVIDANSAMTRPMSMVLDSANNPVIAYYDGTGKDLYVLRCADPSCQTSTTQIVDSAGDVGSSPSLALDSQGFPVVAYYDDGSDDLKVLHCNDLNCAPGGDSITRPDSAGTTGQDPSLVLNSAGNPVVAYYDRSSGGINVLRCDDPNCTPAGNTINTPAAALFTKADPSLVLDAAGNPVIAYYAGAGGAEGLGLVHCNDPACAPGGDSNVIADGDQYAGENPSLKLDAAGNPVIAYRRSFVHNDLRVLHCDDPNCAPGGNALSMADNRASTGWFASLALTQAGQPVVTYLTDGSPTELSVLYCDDPNCSAGSLSKSTPIATTGRSATQSVLAFDSAGLPVIAYGSFVTGQPNSLSLLRCDDLACGSPPMAVADTGYETYNVASLTVPAPGLLANDVDSDSPTLTASVVNQPNSGSVVVNSNGSFTYTPTTGFVGSATFTYKANDPTSASAPASVTINVEAPVYCDGRLVTIDMRKATAGSPTNGDDVIFGTTGPDIIDALAGDDTICAGDGDDIVNGGTGVDFIYGGEGDDTLSGGDGNDRIRGQQGVDSIAGNDGKDFLYGGTGGDTINGNDGNDLIGGFGGADTINAGAGNDTVFGGFGGDTINGGTGNDELFGLIGNDTIHGDAGNDTIYGDNGQDAVFGDAGNDTLFGGNSLDLLRGGSGDDNLNGGKSDDSLDGGTGTDTCTGNRGIDTASSSCENSFGVP